MICEEDDLGQNYIGEFRAEVKRYSSYLESCWSGGISWAERLEKSLSVLTCGSRHGRVVSSSGISRKEDEWRLFLQNENSREISLVFRSERSFVPFYKIRPWLDKNLLTAPPRFFSGKLRGGVAATTYLKVNCEYLLHGEWRTTRKLEVCGLWRNKSKKNKSTQENFLYYGSPENSLI